MKKIIILIILLTFALLLTAEENLKHGLGFTGGMTSGSGFSYRQMNENFGFQIALGALMNNSSDCEDCFAESFEGDWINGEDDIYTEYSYGKTMHLNLGINFYKPLHHGKKSSLYLLAGTAGYLFREEVAEQDYYYNEDDDLWVQSGQKRVENDTEFTINVGAGFGIEYSLNKNIKLNFEWPLVFSFEDKDLNIFMYIPQAGIHYYFK